MTIFDDPFWDDPFHLCAIWAYVIVAAESGRNPPDSEKVRERAYQLYEEENRRGERSSDAFQRRGFCPKG